jgi:hypothetical protein
MKFQPAQCLDESEQKTTCIRPDSNGIEKYVQLSNTRVVIHDPRNRYDEKKQRGGKVSLKRKHDKRKRHLPQTDRTRSQETVVEPRVYCQNFLCPSAARDASACPVILLTLPCWKGIYNTHRSWLVKNLPPACDYSLQHHVTSMIYMW